MVKAQTNGAKVAVSIFGATGSIGKNALDLIRRAPERYEIVALTAHRDGRKLAALAREHGAKLAVLAEPEGYRELCEALAGSGIRTAAGREGLLAAAGEPADVGRRNRPARSCCRSTPNTMRSFRR